MTTQQPVTVSILRHEGRACSACRRPIDAAVMVRPDRETAAAHFLFCRRCAARIGVVAEVMGRSTQPRRQRGASKLATGGE